MSSTLFKSIFRCGDVCSTPLNVFKGQQRTMCKFDRSLWKRRYGPKRGNKHYYKGNQTRSEGVWTKRGEYFVYSSVLFLSISIS